VILAGGKGTRLAPYTTVLPKPLMPIGNRAILDVIVHEEREPLGTAGPLALIDQPATPC
jgi:UTP-glucose-1-phosphate uridylyltransferase